MYTLNCNGKPLLVNKTLIMGILNYTTDSFYAGSRLDSDEAVIQKAAQMSDDGADIIDVGAQSTRPGSTRIEASKEIKKIINLIPLIKQKTKKFISVDTYHAEMAHAAVEAGADIINDISGGTMDENMIRIVGKLKVPYICMHIKGTPDDMQKRTNYEDLLKEILDFFIERIEQCRTAGIHDVIIDPGFGFAKKIHQNFFLLKHLSIFKMLEKPIMTGLSRKSTIYKTLGITAEDALNGTTVMNTLGIQNGANIIRVHDVKEAVQVVKLLDQYNKSQA